MVVLQTAIPTGILWYFLVAALLCHFPLDTKGGGSGDSAKKDRNSLYLWDFWLVVSGTLKEGTERWRQRDENDILQQLPSEMSEQEFIIIKMVLRWT